MQCYFKKFTTLITYSGTISVVPMMNVVVRPSVLLSAGQPLVSVGRVSVGILATTVPMPIQQVTARLLSNPHNAPWK